MHRITHKYLHYERLTSIFTVFRSKFNCVISWTCVRWYCLVHNRGTHAYEICTRNLHTSVCTSVYTELSAVRGEGSMYVTKLILFVEICMRTGFQLHTHHPQVVFSSIPPAPQLYIHTRRSPHIGLAIDHKLVEMSCNCFFMHVFHRLPVPRI